LRCITIASLTIVVFLCLFFAAALSANQQGKAIFKSKGCALCHKQDGPSRGSIPSLSELAKAYRGQKDRLIQYLKGSADPILIPKRAIAMKRPLRKTKALSDSERSALADFILQR
jgi:cytochrome c551/c552